MLLHAVQQRAMRCLVSSPVGRQLGQQLQAHRSSLKHLHVCAHAPIAPVNKGISLPSAVVRSFLRAHCQQQLAPATAQSIVSLPRLVAHKLHNHTAANQQLLKRTFSSAATRRPLSTATFSVGTAAAAEAGAQQVARAATFASPWVTSDTARKLVSGWIFGCSAWVFSMVRMLY